MSGKKPDRIPVMCQLATGHIYCNAGLLPFEYLCTSQGYVRGNIIMTEQYRFDGILSDVSEILSPDISDSVCEITKTREGHILSTACSMSPKVPPENVYLLYEAVEKCGCLRVLKRI